MVRGALAESGSVHLRLNLFDDVDLQTVVERKAKTRYGYSLSGRIDGIPHGSVTLVVSPTGHLTNLSTASGGR